MSVDLRPRAGESYEPHPKRCQSCGAAERDSELAAPHYVEDVTLYQEHDQHGAPELVLVPLCEECAGVLVDAHPRLYLPLDSWAPWPGVMADCRKCAYRRGLACGNPLLKANGGEGLPLIVPLVRRTAVMHVDPRTGKRTGRPIRLYSGPTRCKAATASIPEPTVAGAGATP